MALQKPDGTYIVVEDVQGNTIVIREHANAEHRARYKAGTETAWESTRQRAVQNGQCLLQTVVNADETILNNAKIVAYEELKNMSDFSDCIDV